MRFLSRWLFHGLVLIALMDTSLQAQGFALSSSPGVGNSPQSLIAADMNNDAKVDLVVSIGSGNSPLILTNNGNGSFVQSASVNLGQAWEIAAADINGDGKKDLIVATSGLVIFTNNGAGGFAVSASLNAYALSAIAYDVNGDGKIDIVSAGGGTAPNFIGSVLVFTNNGIGVFSLSSSNTAGAQPYSVRAADFNNDGRLDLVCANEGIYPNYVGTFFVFTNNGAGGFGSNATYSAGCNPLSVATADMNGDGYVDVICPSRCDQTLLIYTNNRAGRFALAFTPAVGRFPRVISATDVNGDNLTDLICVNDIDNTVSVLTNNGTGNVVAAATLNVGSRPYGLATADVNGDGRFDIVTANYNDGNLFILTNSSTFLPKLAQKRTGSNLVVAWPSQWTSSAGWSLQQNTNLNSTNWTGFGGVIGDEGTTKTVTNSLMQGNLFFRLSHP